MYPDLLTLIKRVKSHQIKCSLTTNFSLMTEEKIKELIDSGLDELTISLWASDDAVYQRTHSGAPPGLFGRIDKELVRKMLRKYGDRSFDAHYLCGPEEMIDTVKQELLKSGAEEEKIMIELFTSTSHKKEVKKDLSGNTRITIILDDEKTEFEMRKDEFILDAALAKGLDAPYSCQGGICSSCLARVTEGKAMMEKNSILDEDEVQEGLILTCQAHPVTDEIKIDYDDV